MSIEPLVWTTVCAVDDILPDTGVCALAEGRPVAVFRVGHTQFYAIDNVDPKSGAEGEHAPRVHHAVAAHAQSPHHISDRQPSATIPHCPGWQAAIGGQVSPLSRAIAVGIAPGSSSTGVSSGMGSTQARSDRHRDAGM